MYLISELGLKFTVSFGILRLIVLLSHLHAIRFFSERSDGFVGHDTRIATGSRTLLRRRVWTAVR